MPRAAALLLALLLATPAGAGPLLDRTALGAEIRALLRDEPEIVERALAPPDPYADAVDEDRALLADLAPQLFDAPGAESFGPPDAPHRIALFIAPDCPDCQRAIAELRALTETHPLRVTLLEMTGPHAALAATLGLDTAPSYVLRDMMFQGHMPAMVLERYLSR